MTFSPEDDLGSVPPPAEDDFDAKWGTGGLSLEPTDGQSADGEPGSIDTSGLELEPMADAPKSPLDGYTAEMQAADAELYGANRTSAYSPAKVSGDEREYKRITFENEGVSNYLNKIEGLAFDIAIKEGIDTDLGDIAYYLRTVSPVENFKGLKGYFLTEGDMVTFFSQHNDMVYTSINQSEFLESTDDSLKQRISKVRDVVVPLIARAVEVSQTSSVDQGSNYSQEVQTASTEPYSMPDDVAGVSSTELFAKAESAADKERTEQISRVENFDELLNVLISWGDRIPHPDGYTVYLPNVINKIKRYRNGQNKVSYKALRADRPPFDDITRTNGIRDKVHSLFEKQGFMYTGENGVKESIINDDE